jgi:hypothetical protein
MNNPYALVITFTVSAVIVAVALGILSRLFPSPGAPARSTPPGKPGAPPGDEHEVEGDDERSLS